MKSSAISSSIGSTTTASRMESRRSSERLCCNPLNELSQMFRPSRKSSVCSIKQIESNNISQEQSTSKVQSQQPYEYPRRGSAIQLSSQIYPQENKLIQNNLLMEDKNTLECLQKPKQVNNHLQNERQYFSQLKHTNDSMLIKRRSSNTLLDHSNNSYIQNQECVSDMYQKLKNHQQWISQCSQKENYQQLFCEKDLGDAIKRQQQSKLKQSDSLLLESDLVEDIADKTMKELKCSCCKSQITDLVDQLIEKVRIMGESQGQLQIKNTKLKEQLLCLQKEKQFLQKQIYYGGQITYVKYQLEETEKTLRVSEQLINDLNKEVEQKKQELFNYQRQYTVVESNISGLLRKEQNLVEQIEKLDEKVKKKENENVLIDELKEANSALRTRIVQLEKIVLENKDQCDRRIIKHKQAMGKAQLKLETDKEDVKKQKSSLDMVIQEINAKKAIIESEDRILKERQKQLLEREKHIKEREQNLNGNNLGIIDGREQLIGDYNNSNKLTNNYSNQLPALNYNLKNTFLPLPLSQHGIKNDYRYQQQQSYDKGLKVDDINQSRIGNSKNDCQRMRTFNDEPLITQSIDNDSNYNLPSFQQQPESDDKNNINNSNINNSNNKINKNLRIIGFDSSPNLHSRNNECSFDNWKAGQQESANKQHIRQSHNSVRCFSGGEIDQDESELRMSALKLNEEIMHKKMEIELQSMVRQKEKLDEREKELKRLEEKIKVKTPTISPTRITSQQGLTSVMSQNKKENAK